MTVSADVGLLLLYIAQQLGIVLGFGAQAILVMTYLLGKRDGIINETEDAIAHGVYRVLNVSLFFAVASAGIMSVLFVLQKDEVLSEPAFYVKWALIILACIFARALKGSRLWNPTWEGISAGNWGALFLIHIFAPVTTYAILAKIYFGWMAGFLVAWYLLLFALRGHNVFSKMEEFMRNRQVAKPQSTPAPVTPAPPVRPVILTPKAAPPPPPPAPAPVFSTPPVVHVPPPLPKKEVLPAFVSAPKPAPQVPHITLFPEPHKPVPELAPATQPAPHEVSIPVHVQEDTVSEPQKPSAPSDPEPLADLPGFHVMPRTLDELRKLEERRSPKTA